MGADVFRRTSFHSLAPPGDAKGVFCDEDGPAIGPIRLLTKTASGFAPRSVGELNGLFAYVVERSVDCSTLVKKLSGVAMAMNEGDRVRAVLATLFMHLPSLSEEQALRAAKAENLFKASPDDPEHPGWPKGTEGGKGGQFRPKDDAAPKTVTTDGLARLVVRRQLRLALVHMLSRHALRLAVEAAGDAVPGVDLAAGEATIAELIAMAEEFATLKRAGDAAIEFVRNGPYSLEQLRVSPDSEAFSSFAAFKKFELDKRFGPAGDGYQYHHIVEQSASGDIPESELQSTANIVRIPTLLHEEINSRYSKWERELIGSPRSNLNGANFDGRWNAGLKVMRDIGILREE